jgi:hypothetical protein
MLYDCRQWSLKGSDCEGEGEGQIGAVDYLDDL